MKAIRVALYPPNASEPVMMVTLESDLEVPLEEAVALYSDFKEGFVVVDVFEVEDGLDIPEVALLAVEIQQAASERERHMALLYYWDAAQLGLLQTGGVLTMTQPSPLAVEDIVAALTQLAQHPDYDHHHVFAISHDERVVRMHDGECEVVGP